MWRLVLRSKYSYHDYRKYGTLPLYEVPLFEQSLWGCYGQCPLYVRCYSRKSVSAILTDGITFLNVVFFGSGYYILQICIKQNLYAEFCAVLQVEFEIQPIQLLGFAVYLSCRFYVKCVCVCVFSKRFCINVLPPHNKRC